MAEGTMSDRDTAGAMQALKVAQSYIDDFMNQDIDYKKIEVLKQATRYIKIAEEKDPDAAIPDSDGAAYAQQTVNSLAATALFYESQISSTSAKAFDEDSEKYTRPYYTEAKNCLVRALEYQPTKLQYREHLVDALIGLRDQPGALEVAREGLRLSPNSIEAQKLIDRVEGTRKVAPATASELFYKDHQHDFFLAYQIGLVVLVIILLYYLQFILAALVAGGLVLWTWWANKQYESKQRWKDYRQ